MAKPEYTTSNQLPKNAVRDVCLVGDKILETDSNGDKIYRDISFKHFNST